jgi:Cu2+-exporting ATPase
MQRVKSTTTLLLVAGLLVLVVGCDRRADLVRTVFTVEGMHCDACSTSITTTLEKVEGVDEVIADHELGFAEAIHRSREVGADQLKTEIENLGYTVTGMETDEING